ncbi:MAG: aldehyde dehydrogenase family protein [Geminicoccaceae bacterium]
MRHYDCLIDGVEQPAADGRSIEMLCPSDGLAIATVARGGAAEVDAAVRAARRALDAGPYGRLTAVERGRILSRLAAAVTARHAELAALEAKDCGKPMAQARTDITCLARYLEFYGGAADKVHGTQIPFLGDWLVTGLREPHGVTAHIIPWNYPAQIFGRSVGAALAMGNACVLKPAEDAGLTCLEVARLALECGLPPGALNVVTGYGEEAGAALSQHDDIDFISFTGSPEIGTAIQTAAARRTIGCTLELGGKSAQLVFADADLDKALPVIVNAIIQTAGQTCSAGSRVLIEASVFDAVTARLAERFGALRVGTHAMDLDLGPLINRQQAERVQRFVERAADLPLLAEGRLAPDLPAGGYYAVPRLYGPVPADHVLAQEEVFGPVLVAMPFTDEAEALRLANGTSFGLVAGVWTRDGGRQMRVARRLRAGQVYVNGYGAGGGIELPFGGVKRSGHGREKGFEALYEFSQLKTIAFHHG